MCLLSALLGLAASHSTFAVGSSPRLGPDFRQRQGAILQAAASNYDPNHTRSLTNRVQHGFHASYLLAALEVNRRGLSGGVTLDQAEDRLRTMVQTAVDRMDRSHSSSWNSSASGVSFSPAFKFAPMVYGYIFHQWYDELPLDIRSDILWLLRDSDLRNSPGSWLTNGRINVLAGRLLVGERLGHDSTLWQSAYNEFHTIYNNVMTRGAIEMNSPVYGLYHYSGLTFMNKLAHNEIRNRARILTDNQLMIAGHLYLQGGGIGIPRGRDRAGAYGGSGNLPRFYHLFFGEPASAGSGSLAHLIAAAGDYQPPRIIESFFTDKVTDDGYELWTYTAQPLSTSRLNHSHHTLGPDNARVSPWHVVASPEGNIVMGGTYGHRGFTHHITTGAWVRTPGGNFQVYYHLQPLVSGDTYDNGGRLLGPPDSNPDNWDGEGYDFERFLWGRTLLSIWNPTLEHKSSSVVRQHQDTRARIPNLANHGGEMIIEDLWFVGRMGSTYLAYRPIGEIDSIEGRDGGDWYYIRLNGHSGYIMEMATTDDFDSVQDYADDLASRRLVFSPGATNYHVEFDARDPQTGELTRLRLDYRPDRRFIDGQEVTMQEYDRGYIHSPWIDWNAETRIKTLSREGYPSVVYNIDSGQIFDEDAGPAVLVLIGTATNPATLHGVRNFLEEHDYSVTISSDWADETIGSSEADQIAATYDLVIASTEAHPREYADAGWQILSIPILSLSPYLPFAFWDWAPGATLNDESDAFDVESADHPLLDSVTTTEAGTVVYHSGDASLHGLDSIHGDGETVLSQEGRTMFAFWNQGELDGNPAPRVFLNLGFEALLDSANDEGDRDFDTSNIDRLTDDGKQLLLNAADFLVGRQTSEASFYSTDFDALATGSIFDRDGWDSGPTGHSDLAAVVDSGGQHPGSPSATKLLRSINNAGSTRTSARHALRAEGDLTPIWTPFTVEIVAAFNGGEPANRFYIGHGTWGGAAVTLRHESDTGNIGYRDAAGFHTFEYFAEPNTFYRFIVDIRPGPAEPWNMTTSSGDFDVRIFDMDDNLVAEAYDLKARDFWDGHAGYGFPGQGYSYLFEENWSSDSAIYTDSIRVVATEEHQFPPPAVSGFEAWAEQHFTEEERDDPAISGPFADPGGHGVPNLLRYAFGLGRVPSRGPSGLVEPGSTTENDGDGEHRYLTLSFNRLKDDHDLTYSVQASDDLSVWETIDAQEVGTPIDEGDHEKITVRDSETIAGDTSRFLRVEVRID